jgi:hypothetical protein
MEAAAKRTVVAATVLTLLIGVVAVGAGEPLRGTHGPAEAREERDAPAVEVPPPRTVASEEDSGPPAWLAWVIGAGGLVALAVTGVLLVRGLRSWSGRAHGHGAVADTEPDDDEPAGAVGEAGEAALARRAVDAALEPLRDPTDPRSAVIAAYVRMQRVLAERELGRRSPEAPREYLARVLGEGGMPEGSLTTLTEMFEEARFSLHPIPDSAPRRALGELETARSALAARDG